MVFSMSFIENLLQHLLNVISANKVSKQWMYVYGMFILLCVLCMFVCLFFKLGVTSVWAYVWVSGCLFVYVCKCSAHFCVYVCMEVSSEVMYVYLSWVCGCTHVYICVEAECVDACVICMYVSLSIGVRMCVCIIMSVYVCILFSVDIVYKILNLRFLRFPTQKLIRSSPAVPLKVPLTGEVAVAVLRLYLF